MTGLILKDFLILRKGLRAYLSIVLIYGALVLTGALEPSVLGGMLVVIVAMLPMNVFSYDKQAKWDTYGLALPVGRTKTVAARYLTTLLLCLFSLAAVAAFGVVIIAVGRMDDWETYVVSCAACGLLALVTTSVMLPFLYKFGPDQARIVLIGFMAVIFCGILVFFKVFNGVAWLENLGKPSQAQIAAIPVIAALAGLVLLALSFLLSRYFYGKKDI